ncbi:toxin-activating lysine-acyltransferase [Reinekea sp.]|uniref:toxin-activating lysine-acyltransferase n=1 Tax=Reinekea sp. TaxID=1970455 RepID=UPI002A81B2EF|nr:toxin-activating lysine-acyltransferase [Reinekea sp.]
MTNLSQDLAVQTVPGYHENLGMLMCLLNKSKFHGDFLLWNLSIDILPALVRGHLKLYFDDQQRPIGFVIWEWVNSRTISHLINLDATPSLDNCPKREYLLINEFIGTATNAKVMIQDLTDQMFPRDHIFCLSRHADGSIRKVHHWQGAQLRCHSDAVS